MSDHYSGKAAALRIDNLDTDQIMPKQFLRGIDKSGLAQGLLHDLRYAKTGSPNTDFVLNRPQAAGTRVLIGGSNFGCGSSREHAVWGLLQYGIRAIVAPSFAEIFFSNAMGNRLLLVQLPPDVVEEMMDVAERDGAPDMEIDIVHKRVSFGGMSASFPLSSRHQEMFLKGVDVIGMTLTHEAEIRAFAESRWQKEPWTRDVAARMSALRQSGAAWPAFMPARA